MLLRRRLVLLFAAMLVGVLLIGAISAVVIRQRDDTRNGSLRLLRLAGVEVFVHWSWFVVALVEFQFRVRNYQSPAWNVAELS